MSSNQTLSDFIADRLLALQKAEVKAFEVFSKAMEDIRLEREQLQKAAEAAGLPTEPKSEDLETQDTSEKPKRRSKVASEKTIKDAVMQILHQSGRGMTAMEILPQVNEMLGIDYPRTSLSPQISRLGKKGYLVREGVVWHLTDKGRAAYGLKDLTGEFDMNDTGQKKTGEVGASPDVFD